MLPQDLPEVLKNFTKEVIRHDPEDVLQFSALYFDNLAQVSQTLEEVVPPTLEQVRAVHAHLGGVSMTQTEAMRAACADAGVPAATVEKAFQLGAFGGGLVEPHEVLVMLVAMMGDGLKSALEATFQVFGDAEGQIDTVDFVRLFGYIAAKDPEIPASAKEEISGSLGIVEKVKADENLFLRVIMSRLGL